MNTKAKMIADSVEQIKKGNDPQFVVATAQFEMLIDIRDQLKRIADHFIIGNQN